MNPPPSPPLPLGPTAPPRHAAVDEEDPELAALPAPPRGERALSVLTLALTGAVAVLLALSLATEARFSMSTDVPVEAGELSRLSLGPELADHVVHGTGILATDGAIRFGRPLESDTFRVAPIVGAPRVWVEIRVPAGTEGPRFIPPTSFVGRMVPLREAGLRHRGLASAIASATGTAPPGDAWLLVDGAIPEGARWSVPLVALLVTLAAAALATAASLLRPVRG